MSFCDVIGLSKVPKMAGLSGGARLPRRLRSDRQGMDGASEFRSQRCINHAVTLDSGLPFEGGRYDMHSKMRLAARPVASMAFMKM
jgi:hypothetical protein